MADLLFTHSYFYKFDSKQWENKTPYPPYGTLYAAGLMREKGYSVSVFDNALNDKADEIFPSIKKEKPKYLIIYDDGFNYLTKMCLTNMREAAFEVSQLGKKSDCTVIVSSSDSTDHYAQYLAQGADFVLLGEGELTLLELIENLEQQTADFSHVLGIAYKKGDEIIKNPSRPVLRNLDDLPDPAWDLIDLKPYREIWTTNHGFFSLNIATTRGCPYKCNWCAKPIYGNRYNSRSPERVVNELEMLIKTYGVQYFWVCDDIFGLKKGWVNEFRDLVVAKQLPLKYKIQSRVDLLLQEDNINALAQSGLDTVWVGAESGSQKILDAMDKGTELEQIYEATRLLKKLGVKVAFFLQFGYLGETREDIQKTINMVKDLVPDDIGISVSYPLPGTKFYEKVADQLKNKQNWTDSDDLAMMYQATFSSAYYKRLHRYVHKEFRKKQGVNNLKQLLKNPLKIDASKLRSALATFYYIPASQIDAFRLKQLENQVNG